MMRRYTDKNGNIKYIGCHTCCCGEDRTETKQDENGFYKICVYCGIRSKSVENRINVLFAWNSMMREIFEGQYSVGKCCRIPNKKLFIDNQKFWYECKSCGFKSEKSEFLVILKEWNREVSIVENTMDLLLE